MSFQNTSAIRVCKINKNIRVSSFFNLTFLLKYFRFAIILWKFAKTVFINVCMYNLHIMHIYIHICIMYVCMYCIELYPCNLISVDVGWWLAKSAVQWNIDNIRKFKIQILNNNDLMFTVGMFPCSRINISWFLVQTLS